MKYVNAGGINYFPIRVADAAFPYVFCKNICFTTTDGIESTVLFTDFGPPELDSPPPINVDLTAALTRVAAENESDLISAMLGVLIHREFSPDDAAKVEAYQTSVNMMIGSLTKEQYQYSLAGGFTEVATASPVSLTDIIEPHCTLSEEKITEEETTMDAPTNTDILSMEELLKLAEEAPSAEEVMAAPAPEPVIPEEIPTPAVPEPVAPEIPIPEPVVEETPVVPEEPVVIPEEAAAPEAVMPKEPVVIPEENATPEAVMPEEPDVIPEETAAPEAVMPEEPVVIPEETAAPEIPIPEPIVEETPVVPEEPVVIPEEAVVTPEEAVMPEGPVAPEIPVEEPAVPIEEEVAVIEDTPILEEEPVIEETPVMPEIAPEPVVEEDPISEAAAEKPVMPEAIPEPMVEEAPMMSEPTPDPAAAPAPEPSGAAPLLIPMNDSSAHRVICVRVDAESIGLAIPGDYPLMISDDTIIFPENDTLITRNLLTGEQESTALNESVLAAFSYSIEHFAEQNESYTAKSVVFEWFFRSLLKLQETPETAQKMNDYFAFIGCPISCTGTGFTDASGSPLSVAEVFEKLSTIKA